MRKMRTTIGIVIDTLGSIIIYAVIALAILFMAGQAKHYYDVGYGVFSQQGKDARGTGKVVAFTVEEGIKAPKLAEQLEEQGIIESHRVRQALSDPGESVRLRRDVCRGNLRALLGDDDGRDYESDLGE